MQNEALLGAHMHKICLGAKAKRNLLSLSRTKDLLMTINNYSQTL
jgi:hypothetical protein